MTSTEALSFVQYNDDGNVRLEGSADKSVIDTESKRMELEGGERRRFLSDVANEKHPLCKEYRLSAGHHTEDIDAALNMAAVSGDPKALRLEYELRHQDRVDELKRKLFDI